MLVHRESSFEWLQSGAHVLCVLIKTAGMLVCVSSIEHICNTYFQMDFHETFILW